MTKRVIFFVLTMLLVFPLKSFAGDKPSVTVTSLHQWVTNRMLSWNPPGRSMVKGAQETPEEGKKRYEEIANSLINVVYDSKEKPIFSGKYGRARTLALILSVSYFESGFRKDVDFGVGPSSRGDNGKSWCMMQVMLGPAGVDGNTRKKITIMDNYYKLSNDSNWGGLDLVNDREKCFRVGLHLIRSSFASCSGIPVEDRLSVYGAGECISNWKPSRYRVRKAQDWFSAEQPPLSDVEVLDILFPGVSVTKKINDNTI
jgi:hypothetical protein